MPLDIKICGVRTPGALDAALDAGADFVGFVFFPQSPRHIDLSQASELSAQVRRRAGKVALIVDAQDDTIRAITESLKPDMLQLHGGESPERVRAIRVAFGLPVVKALAIAEPGDLGKIARYEGAADRLLFDARPPRGATRPGGLGQAFDWTLLRGIETAKPYFLSGGLNAGNVAEALRITGAPGVDVSSGVERAPGEKDAALIREFIAAARAAAPSDNLVSQA